MTEREAVTGYTHPDRSGGGMDSPQLGCCNPRGHDRRVSDGCGAAGGHVGHLRPGGGHGALHQGPEGDDLPAPCVPRAFRALPHQPPARGPLLRPPWCAGLPRHTVNEMQHAEYPNTDRITFSARLDCVSDNQATFQIVIETPAELAWLLVQVGQCSPSFLRMENMCAHLIRVTPAHLSPISFVMMPSHFCDGPCQGTTYTLLPKVLLKIAAACHGSDD